MSIEAKKGTTTVGLIFKDGVILGSESRASMGNYISTDNAKKVFQINEYTGMTIAGLIADGQKLVDILKTNLNFYVLEHKRKPSIKTIASFLSYILYSQKMFPYYIGIILGGVKDGEKAIYSYDALGGYTKEKFTAVGSGSFIAYGVLELQYKDDLEENEAIELVKKAIEQARKRDSASGGKIQILVIKENEIKELRF